jgi:hypothetical protein
MSATAPAGVSGQSQATVRAARRRGRRLAKLYWHLWRPRPRAYARAVARIAICRVTAAVMAGLAITLCGFVGTVLGNMSYPRWPTTRNLDDGWAVSVAVVPVVVQLSNWVPAIALFAVILTSIPRARIWIFRFTVLGGLALGFYQRHLPAFPQPAAVDAITRRVALAASWAQRHLIVLIGNMQALQAQSAKQPADWVPLVYIGAALIIILIAHGFYRDAYNLTLRTGSFFPRRPRSHGRSPFYVMSLSRRLAAALVTAGLLSVDLWILQNIRASLPAVHYGVASFGYNQIAGIVWVIVALAAALMVCTPRPRGYLRLWIALLLGVTAYAASTHVHLLHLPAWIPPAPQGFWTIVIAYFIVTGFCFDLVGVLLDWPVYIPPFARIETLPSMPI